MLEYMAGLLRELRDDEMCNYDHHGYCQTHRLSKNPCIMQRVRDTIGDGEDE